MDELIKMLPLDDTGKAVGVLVAAHTALTLAVRALDKFDRSDGTPDWKWVPAAAGVLEWIGRWLPGVSAERFLPDGMLERMAMRRARRQVRRARRRARRAAD